MTTISNDFAAELIAKMRAEIDSRDETTAEVPVDPRDLLLIKLWDEVQDLKKGTAFLGVGGGIPAVTRVPG